MSKSLSERSRKTLEHMRRQIKLRDNRKGPPFIPSMVPVPIDAAKALLEDLDALFAAEDQTAAGE